MLLPTYTGNPSLAERFWDLVNVGMPLAEAPALLFDLYITHHFYTMSGLSEIKAFWLDDDSNLVVELSDGSNPDPEKILTRDPRVPDRAPTPLSVLYQIRSMKLEREEIKRLMAAASTEDEVFASHKTPRSGTGEVRSRRRGRSRGESQESRSRSCGRVGAGAGTDERHRFASSRTARSHTRASARQASGVAGSCRALLRRCDQGPEAIPLSRQHA